MVWSVPLVAIAVIHLNTATISAIAMLSAPQTLTPLQTLILAVMKLIQLVDVKLPRPAVEMFAALA